MTEPYYKLKVVKKSIKVRELDIIVLANNELKTTKEFLDLLYKNTDKGRFRLIFIDNGSNDGTVDYVTKFSESCHNVILVASETNLGVIDGRNLGYYFSTCTSLKKSDYLMYIDNDQYVADGWLDHHMAVINRGYDIVGLEAWQMNKMFMPVEKIESLDRGFSYVGCGGSLIRREVTNRVGMFDTRFNPSYFEDPDFGFRAHDKGFKIGWNFKSKIVHMPHQTLGRLSEQDKIDRFTKSWKEFRKKWGSHPIPKLKQVDLPEFH